MLKLGAFEIELIEFGTFRLDGGAMFGAVPKNIWSRRIPADDENCIPLASRALLLHSDDRVILVDVGLGGKYSDKQREIFAVAQRSPEEAGIDPRLVTDVVLTHLHFDHAGGISRRRNGGELELVYPEARVFLQQANWQAACEPNQREKASYLPENVAVLEQAQLELLNGSTEIVPGLWVHVSSGHTSGMQWIEVRTPEGVLAFPSDLVPTARHLPLPFNMGYDLNAALILEEKAEFLSAAERCGWIVVFQHDPDTQAVRVGFDRKGHYSVRERVDI